MLNDIEMRQESTDLLSPNPWNSNHITDPANEERLRESIRRFKMFKPIVVRTLGDGTLQILGGEHRWRAAKQMGMKTVPIVNLGAIDDRRAKEIGLVDNGRYGDDDLGELGKILGELGNDVLEFMPFADVDLQMMLSARSDVDLDDLDRPGEHETPQLDRQSAGPTGQVMRFKIPVEDTVWVTQMIEQQMRAGGFKDEDALSNAGNALVALLMQLRGGRK